MSDRNALLALADRCEAADGPDRFLGREVILARTDRYVSPFHAFMDPTESINAAADMVPAPGKWSITASGDRWQACAWLTDGSPLDWHEAATPALALTAAALRALAPDTPR